MSEARLRLLGAGLETLDRRAVSLSIRHLLSGAPGRVADTLIAHAQDTRRLTHGHTLLELRRAYAYGHPLDYDEDDLADEYRDYLSDLAGVASRSVLERTQETLEQAHRDGLDVNGAAERLRGVLSGFSRGRLRTIVRTEGTRVAAKTRQDLAERAVAAGFGPSHMRWSAILDDRVTETCTCAHGHVRPLEMRDERLRLPAHYNCRSLEVFVYPDELDAGGWTPWTEDEIERFVAVRAQEFPGWA